jgi:ferritin-like protein
MVQRAGVNVDKLLDLLVRSAPAEVTTCFITRSCGSI